MYIDSKVFLTQIRLLYKRFETIVTAFKRETTYRYHSPLVDWAMVPLPLFIVIKRGTLITVEIVALNEL